jgi:hypothetical protein
MKQRKQFNFVLFSMVFSVLLNGAVLALSEVTTVESRVISGPAAGSTDYTYMINGPGNVQYRIEAPPSEVQRIHTYIQSNPEAVVKFSGSVEDMDGTKVFKVSKWEETSHTTKTTTTDSNGNTKVTEHTETNSLR